MAEDDIMTDVVGMEVDDDVVAEKNDAIDIDRLLGLLKASKKAGDLIAKKHVMLLIGLTGAGKTTSTLYLAGAIFEEEVVGGYAHYKPTEIPYEALSEFAVSGGANSVTKTIQATTIVLKGGDAEQKERITICDTPGFGDSKGHEQEISNGLGIIHALKGAASIKPVIVIDHRTMDGGRFAPLRKNLSTVIAMMGRDSIDFSPFSYIFTRCEGKSKKRVSQQLLFFQDAVRQDPHMKDRDILDALLTDMISKTKPGDAICIDPEVPDDASATLKRLWSGSRLNDPANRFVNFCSKESMAALFMQVNILIHDIERSLSASDLNSAAEQLNKMLGLAKALTLPEVDEAIEHGTSKAKKFVISLSSDIKNLVTHADVEFEQKLNDMSSKLYLLSQSGAIREICQMDFDYCSFVNDITGRIFAMTRKPISDINAIVSGSENVLQQSIKRYILVVNSFQDILDENKIETENSMMVKAADDLINPIIVVLGDALNRNDPKSSTLNECLPKLNFVLAMNAFFRSSTFSALNSKISQCNLFETELKNIVDNISDMSENCVTHLVDLDKALHEEHLGEAEWSVSSILKFDDIAESKECRDFLQAVLTSDSLVTSIQNDSDLKSLIRDFDDAVRKYVPSLVLFLQDESQAVFDNETGNMTDRVNKAHTIINSVDFVFVIATTLKDLDSTLFQKALDELNDVKSRSKYFTDESKKASIHHTIRRGKTLQPTEEELARTHQKKDTRNLLRWYERCNELKVYWKKHGHCNVPRKDPRLGQWVQVQRRDKIKYEAGLKTPITDEKIQHLFDMDFQWNFQKERSDATWNHRLEELKQFKDEHGHCRVPQKSCKLGKWVKEQRRTRIRARNNKERIAKLEAIGLFD